MSNSNDWKDIRKRWRVRFFEKSLCELCNGEGMLEEDHTPRNYWETGPVKKEVECPQCPQCEHCSTVINSKEVFPNSFQLESCRSVNELPIPENDRDIVTTLQIKRKLYPTDFGEARPLPWIFCSRGCFMDFVSRATNKSSSWYHSEDSIIFRAFLFESMLDSQDF